MDPAKKSYETRRIEQEKEIEKLTELQRIYALYQASKTESGSYDFNDMILYVVKEIEGNDILATELALKYQFVMVDEFQDLSNAQSRLVEGLLRMAETPNIATVGDDDQSIYRFQ